MDAKNSDDVQDMPQEIAKHGAASYQATEQLSHEERLKLIQKEVVTLYDFCKSQGFTEDNMSWCLKPFDGNPPEFVSVTLKKNKIFLFWASVIIAVVATVAYHQPTYRTALSFTRLGMIKFNYNFSISLGELADEDQCLLQNFVIQGNKTDTNYNITQDDCAQCLMLLNQSLPRVSNVSRKEMIGIILEDVTPAIIEDGLRGWPNSNITLPFLHKTYTTDEKLMNLSHCNFKTSLLDVITIDKFFSTYGNESFQEDSWYAFWENCNITAAKIFRRYYKRPYFLPSMLDIGYGGSNYIFVGKGYLDVENGLFIEKGEMGYGMWTAVLSGELLVKLVPQATCQETFKCENTTLSLKSGEAFFAPLAMNSLYLATYSSIETVALGTMLEWTIPEDD